MNILALSILHFSGFAIFRLFLHYQKKTPATFWFETVCLGFALSCKVTSGRIALFAFILEIYFNFQADFLSWLAKCFAMGIIIFSILLFFYVVHLEIVCFSQTDTLKDGYIEAYLVQNECPNWVVRSQRPNRIFQSFFFAFALIGRECFLSYHAIPLVFGILRLACFVDGLKQPLWRGFFYYFLLFSLFGYFR